MITALKDGYLGTDVALTAIREGLKVSRFNGGLLHFLIHLCEMSNDPGPMCYKECKDLSKVAGDYGHL
jgi:hypothetical protein